MGIPYLMNQPWTSWTRDERFFCSVLYSHARHDAAGFANRLIDTASLTLPPQSSWELGFEVCFYRDYMWHMGGKTAARAGLPRKRTYDLCLFGDKTLVIIEAKVCDRFSTAQNAEFMDDKRHLKDMLGSQCPDVRIVALASARYLKSARHSTIDWFDGCLSWDHVADWFDEPLLRQAASMYLMKPKQFFTD